MNTHALFSHQIESRFDSALPIYLLVDPHKSVAEDWPVSLSSLRQTLGEEAITEIPRADFADHASQYDPCLVQLTHAGETPSPEIGQLIASSVRIARSEHPGSRRYICGWLQSAADAQSIAQALAARMLIIKNHPDGNPHGPSGAAHLESLTPANARFYPIHEPLRQELMAYACQTNEANAAAYARWFGAIARWLVPTAGGQGIVNIAGRASMNSMPGPDFQRPAPELPHVAVLAQADAFYVANVLSVWYDMAYIRPLSLTMQQQMPFLLRHQPLPPNAAWQCLMSLRVALSCGLKNRHDLVTLAVMRILAHPCFERHPTVIAAIRRAARGEARLGDALASVTAPQWMAILHDLDTTA